MRNLLAVEGSACRDVAVQALWDRTWSEPARGAV